MESGSEENNDSQEFISPKEDVSKLKQSSDEGHLTYQASFPNWPQSYFNGIVPTVQQNAIYFKYSTPIYDYTKNETAVVDIPAKDTEYKPADPEPMYVLSMPWCTYPYGVPAKL